MAKSTTKTSKTKTSKAKISEAEKEAKKEAKILAKMEEESLSINNKKKRIVMEEDRQAALKIKHDLEEEKRDFYQRKLDEVYKKIEDHRKKVPVVIDLIDMEDMVTDLDLIKDAPIRYGEVSEKERKKIFESLEPKLPVIAMDIARSIRDEGKYSIDKKKKALENWKPVNEILDKLKLDIRDNFQVASPRYNRYICCCCGKPQPLDNFGKAWTPITANLMDNNGWFHTPWCKKCAIKLFEYYYLKKADRNAELAMEMYCCTTNTYWDINLFQEAQRNLQSNDVSLHILSEYNGVLNRAKANTGLTYWDSPTIQHRNITLVHGENKELESKLVYNPEVIEKIKVDKNSTILDVSSIDASDNKYNIPLDWDKQDAKNKIKIIKMIGYDPFEYEEEADKKILYKDFLNILELGMEGDFTKLQAALQIVLSFYRIRKMDKIFADKQKEGATSAELQGISKLKANELDTITKFTRDHGFAEKYAMGKAKGENTLTGVMNRMSNAQYEKSILNAYDIKTSKTIQQAADASIKAINDQLSMGESDLYKVIQDQLSVIQELRKQNSEQKEEIRLFNRKETERKLVSEAQSKGLIVTEDEEDNEEY